MLPIGLLTGGLVVIRLLVLVYTSIQQVISQREQDRLSLQLLSDRISEQKRQQDVDPLAWNGYRKFVIDRTVSEGEGISSFYLAPHDKKPLPGYRPGQYLTFRLAIPGREKPVVRCYSLSDSHHPECYRITVKRVAAPADSPDAPAGLVSNYFHEQLGAGDILDVQAPRGQFFLDPEHQRPAVFLAGGIGVTPLLSMAKAVADTRSQREILFFYGVNNRTEHAFRNEIAGLSEQHPSIRVVICYSSPRPDDVAEEGRDYHHDGRITIELIKSYLDSTNYEVYLCGPPAMTESIVPQLAKWGVAKKDIHTEAFGPASIGKGPSKPAAKAGGPKCEITFAKSGQSCVWDGGCGNLLDLALANGVAIESGCRAGNCGTCVVAVKSGRTTYLAEPGAEVEDKACLTCIAAPDGDIVLDA